jgi:hypothetical protein
MAIKRPTGAEYNATRKTSTLFFAEGEPRECYMRGAVCWPVLSEDENKQMGIRGYAIVAGQDVHTGAVWVFEEREFVTIEHIKDDDGNRIVYHGVAPWFNTMWARYFCDDYFWHQDDILTKSYRLELSRSKWCKARPHLIRVDWDKGGDVLHQIWRYAEIGKLKLSDDGKLWQALPAVKRDENDREIKPGLHALKCLIAGLERYPWRKPGRTAKEGRLTKPDWLKERERGAIFVT